MDSFAEALFSLSEEENLSDRVLSELKALDEAFAAEPRYIALLGGYSLTKREKRGLLDEALKCKSHEYVLSTLKLMAEKNCIGGFSSFVKAYVGRYNEARGILEVNAVSAYPLSGSQAERLTEKLEALTGKKVRLNARTDKNCLGGLKIEYAGRLIDDTVRHRLDEMAKALKGASL